MTDLLNKSEQLYQIKLGKIIRYFNTEETNFALIVRHRNTIIKEVANIDKLSKYALHHAFVTTSGNI